MSDFELLKVLGTGGKYGKKQIFSSNIFCFDH
jgi:hypothetical protein